MTRSVRWLTVIAFSPLALLVITTAALLAAVAVLVVGLTSYADLTRSPSPPGHSRGGSTR